MTSTAIRIRCKAVAAPLLEKRSAAGRHGHDLASLIIATCRADAVWYVGRGALGASAQLRQAQHAVIRSAHALAASRRLSLGDTHKFDVALLKFQFVQLSPGG